LGIHQQHVGVAKHDPVVRLPLPRPLVHILEVGLVQILDERGPSAAGGLAHVTVSPSASTYGLVVSDAMNVPPTPRVSDGAKRPASDGATVIRPYASPPGNPSGRLKSVCTLPAPGSSNPS